MKDSRVHHTQIECFRICEIPSRNFVRIFKKSIHDILQFPIYLIFNKTNITQISNYILNIYIFLVYGG